MRLSGARGKQFRNQILGNYAMFMLCYVNACCDSENRFATNPRKIYFRVLFIIKRIFAQVQLSCSLQRNLQFCMLKKKVFS